jgi:hypothetical protein
MGKKSNYIFPSPIPTMIPRKTTKSWNAIKAIKKMKKLLEDLDHILCINS